MKHKSLGKQIENFYSLFVIFIHFGPADAKVGAAAIQLFCTDGHRSRDICISLQCKKKPISFLFCYFPSFYSSLYMLSVDSIFNSFPND